MRPSSQEMKRRKEGYGSKIKDRLKDIQRDLRREERKREAARKKQMEEEREDQLDLELEEEEEELRRISEKKRRKANQMAEKQELIKEEPFSSRKSSSISSKSPSVSSPSSPMRLSNSIDKKKLSDSKDNLFKKEDSPKKERRGTVEKREEFIQKPVEVEKKSNEPAIVELESSDSESEGINSGKEDLESNLESSSTVEERMERTESDSSDDEIVKQSATEETEHYPIVRSLYKYTARTERELSFQLGDEIMYLKEDYGGWWRGQNMRSKECGWFPSNYVQDTGTTVEMAKIKKEAEESGDGEEVEEESIYSSPKMVINITKKVSSGIARLQQKLAKSKTKNALFTKLGLRGSLDPGNISSEEEDED
eukprot:TRINITY_DN7380_c0_g1_i2.p2 TRINITY_DN7380_c0_g1~~TRINITY_DN7380_c0_g1_i2.p2  ORF type:complete len:367 (+),score=177.05 TRINITY_DN7380_c0_g1_i2:294-1394(+)